MSEKIQLDPDKLERASEVLEEIQNFVSQQVAELVGANLQSLKDISVANPDIPPRLLDAMHHGVLEAVLHKYFLFWKATLPSFQWLGVDFYTTIYSKSLDNAHFEARSDAEMEAAGMTIKKRAAVFSDKEAVTDKDLAQAFGGDPDPSMH